MKLDIRFKCVELSKTTNIFIKHHSFFKIIETDVPMHEIQNMIYMYLSVHEKKWLKFLKENSVDFVFGYANLTKRLCKDDSTYLACPCYTAVEVEAK